MCPIGTFRTRPSTDILVLYWDWRLLHSGVKRRPLRCRARPQIRRLPERTSLCWMPGVYRSGGNAAVFRRMPRQQHRQHRQHPARDVGLPRDFKGPFGLEGGTPLLLLPLSFASCISTAPILFETLLPVAAPPSTQHRVSWMRPLASPDGRTDSPAPFACKVPYRRRGRLCASTATLPGCIWCSASRSGDASAQVSLGDPR